jgi:hypothetical protein
MIRWNTFRKNYAGIGYTYDQARDAFIAPKPFNSWILNEDTCRWEAPVAEPTTTLEDNQYYYWNESISIDATIKKYTNENGFAWGINTVMKSLAPGASYDLTSAGEFIIDRWDSPLPQPTSQEIRDEYIRQQTIAECIEYFKTIK